MNTPNRKALTMKKTTGTLLLAAAIGLGACSSPDAEARSDEPEAHAPTGPLFSVRSAERTGALDASGVAAPVAEATLSTKLMGTVTQVLVQEGDAVAAGQPLLRIDARELAAKSSQAEAMQAEAEAVLRESELHAGRMRALYADDAAPRAQVDAAETALARARAGVQAARAGAVELNAMRDYSVVRAPFAGTVVRRLADTGSFAAPGGPLLVVQDASRLRVSATVSPEAVRGLRRGQVLEATIEGSPASAVVEGVVPSQGGSLYTVNALVENADGRHLAGSAATLSIPTAARATLVVPASALVRQGDLTGVYLAGDDGARVRWVRPGRSFADSVEVLAGLKDGDRVVATAVRERR
jgi:RND family efflux transporter MFP subunit